MLKKINYGFAAILLMLAMACNKEPDVSCNSPTNDLALSKELIVGTWRWAYSIQSNRQTGNKDVTTPQSEKVERTMTFCDDGKLEIKQDGKIITKTTFQFRKMSEWSLYPPDSTKYILSWKANNVVWRICTDSLYLPYQSFAFDASKDEVWQKK